MMTGENSMARLQDQREPDELHRCILEIGSTKEETRRSFGSIFEEWRIWPELSFKKIIVPSWTPLQIGEVPLERCRSPRFMLRMFDSTFEEDMIETIKHLDSTVPVVKNKNGHKWHMTEDEYHLWVSLDEATTDMLIQKCPQKAEVVRILRSEAQKDKATAPPSSSIAPGPSTSPPGNCAAESFYLKAAAYTFVGENNESPPDNHKGVYELENTSMVGGQISSCGTPSVQYKPNFTVAKEPKENWLQEEKEIITKESQWNKTEDNDLWALLDKETTDSLTGWDRWNKIEDNDSWAHLDKETTDRRLRSEAPKEKAAVILTGERTLSTASRKQSANPIPYQTSFGGNQVHNQQVDPKDGSVNFAPSNQTDNYAAVTLDLDIANITSITPDNQKSKYDVENTFMVGDQIISTAGSVWAKESSYDMSHNAESLWYFLTASTLVSFILCFDGLLLFGHKPRGMVARLLLCIAYVAIAFAVLATSGLQLPDELRVWITGGACVVSLPAIIGYAMK